MKLRRFICAIVLLVFYCAKPALAVQFESTPRKVNLIELFSSEGCSSCPPADRWVSGLQNQPGLWTEFVPVVFHVDYWDDLGWKDRFASSEYTQHQRDYSAAWRERSIYTPCVVANGKPWRGWAYGNSVPKSGEKPGVLSVKIKKPNQYHVRFAPEQKVEDLEVHIALLGFDIQSDVKRGENSGKMLKHDFLVVAYKRTDLQNQTLSAQVDLFPPGDAPKKLAVAVWLTNKNDPRPLQAVGGMLAG